MGRIKAWFRQRSGWWPLISVAVILVAATVEWLAGEPSRTAVSSPTVAPQDSSGPTPMASGSVVLPDAGKGLEGPRDRARASWWQRDASGAPGPPCSDLLVEHVDARKLTS